MKIVITKCKNRMALIKWIREYESRWDKAVPLGDAIAIVDNLPFNITENISNEESKSLREICEYQLEKDPGDYDQFNCFNINADPPEPYKSALVWQASLSDERKSEVEHILNLSIWINRPAAC